MADKKPAEEEAPDKEAVLELLKEKAKELK